MNTLLWCSPWWIPLNTVDWAGQEPQRLTWGCEGDHRGTKTHKPINFSWWRRFIWWRWLPVISTSLQPVFLSLSLSCSAIKDNIIFLIKGFYIDGNKEGQSLSNILRRYTMRYKWRCNSMQAAAAPAEVRGSCTHTFSKPTDCVASLLHLTHLSLMTEWHLLGASVTEHS